MPLRLLFLCFAVLAAQLPLLAQEGKLEMLRTSFSFDDAAAAPEGLTGFMVGRSGGEVLLAGGREASGEASKAVYHLVDGEWVPAGSLPAGVADAPHASSPAGLYYMSGGSEGSFQQVHHAVLEGGQVGVTDLVSLPFEVSSPAMTVADGWLYVTGFRAGAGPVLLRLQLYRNLSFLQKLLSVAVDFSVDGAQWEELAPPPGAVPDAPVLAFSFESLHLFGLTPDGKPVGYGWHPVRGWRTLTPPPAWGPGTTIAPLGESHLFAFEGATAASGESPSILAYHTLTDSWTVSAPWADQAAEYARAAAMGDRIVVVSTRGTAGVNVLPPANNYGVVDHVVVAIYLIGMVAMGLWFVRREKNTADFFRAGNRVPWWAIGMSLFATAASAISLMTMPGKSYSTDWTFFTISIVAVICLPISLFILAPLVRKLGISTANEYLELRFGLTSRMVGSVIFMVGQVLGRMAPIIYLPAIAMAAITNVDIWVWILVIGIVTTLYTFTGGLSAVIWTDTIQGFIMLGTVAGCLVLILFKIDMPWGDIWTTLSENHKLHTFDWGWDVTQPVVVMIFLSNFVTAIGGVGDQNYVQRVQAAPTLKDAKRAVATQMAVAVPINVLLFGMGTALYLYYRQHPVELNPLMKTDGVFPLFAAQHLPVGVSGLVIAALLAASMSTISSAICSVANLGIDDFYRRFKRNVDEAFTLKLARVMSITVGILGIIGALFLSQSSNKSVWDLALIIVGLVSNGVAGFFGLGLLTKRTHQTGALLGLLAGMCVTVYLQAFTNVTFWLYGPIGSAVTFLLGWGLSYIIPGRVPMLDGLTVYTLDKPRRQL